MRKLLVLAPVLAAFALASGTPATAAPPPGDPTARLKIKIEPEARLDTTFGGIWLSVTLTCTPEGPDALVSGSVSQGGTTGEIFERAPCPEVPNTYEVFAPGSFVPGDALATVFARADLTEASGRHTRHITIVG